MKTTKLERNKTKTKRNQTIRHREKIQQTLSWLDQKLPRRNTGPDQTDTHKTNQQRPDGKEHNIKGAEHIRIR